MAVGRRLSALAVLAFAAGGAATDAEPHATAATGTIVFHLSTSVSGETSGPFIDDIYTVNADGTQKRNLTRNSIRIEDAAPAWSPDGARIAFVRRGQANRDAVFVMNADGRGKRRLTSYPTGRELVGLSWSPDGRRIAFVRNENIWVVRADGTASRRLIMRAGHPAWSPDGSSIAFVRPLRDDSTSAEIFVANADGTRQRRLTRNAHGDTAPAWSPDGDRIAFARFGITIPSGIFVMRPNGTAVRRLTRCDQDCGPSWSPDGRSIAFSRSGGIGGVSPAGGKARWLARGFTPSSLAWSPIG